MDVGKDASVVFVSEASLDELKNAKAFALGCPAMGAEVLEELEMETFVCAVEGFAAVRRLLFLALMVGVMENETVF